MCSRASAGRSRAPSTAERPGRGCGAAGSPLIWITCTDLHRTNLFRSGDGGRTWTRRVANHRLELSGTGGPEAWATSTGIYSDEDSTSTLWHTTDGGATWTEVYVSLPPRAPALQIACAITPSGVLHDPRAACG